MPFSKPEGGLKGGFKEGFKAGPKPAFAKTGFKPAGKSFASKAHASLRKVSSAI